MSKCTKLQYLWISNNQIKSLDVSMLPELLVLDVGDNQLTSIDISSNPKITELFLQGNQIKQLPDIWSLTLTSLHLSGMVSGLPSDFLTHFPELTSVNFSGYDGTTIDLSQNTKLMDVWCWDLSQMPTLDLSAAPKLRSLYCGSWSKTLQTVYIHKNASLETLEKDDNTKIVKK